MNTEPIENIIYNCYTKQLNFAPEHIAVIDEYRTLSRRELDRLADRIAFMLPEGAKRVGIVMDHSVEMIAAIFAVLKSGMAYIPAEPDFPIDRIDFMMKDSGADCIITHKIYADNFTSLPLIFVEKGLEIDEAIPAFPVTSTAESLAYILYTSGSTGKPKGVAVENRNVCHYVRAFQNEFHPSATDVMLQYSVCSFDIFVEEVFTSLLSGAVLAIPPAQVKNEIHSLMEFAEKYKVTMISGFPYLLAEMNRLKDLPTSLRLLISGGDVLRASYVSNLLDKVSVYNTYGPSETTVCASYFKCNGTIPLDDGTYPIGKAVIGSSIEILDNNMLPAAFGQIGEICITGGGVSKGYIGNRQKENSAFVTQKDGTRIYRSGDLGYLLPDGNIAFLHRKDSQVMILGKRVEPTEIESAICRCNEIEKAVIKAYQDEQNYAYLVAYIVPKTEISLSSLKEELSQFLPAYMIPEFFVRMKDIPLNENGKVDTAALPIIMKEGVAA
ncbi:MAG: amino acid adenylation domain-containing protein [Firmicutes bacterium]|nr:amino acid adenylation domain-containing protein [Bacillota bacterium]